MASAFDQGGLLEMQLYIQILEMYSPKTRKCNELRDPGQSHFATEKALLFTGG